MIEELTSLCALAGRLKTEPAKRIGVDGTNGARKTTLAAGLAMELQLPLISLDDYLHRNQGGFIEYLRYEDLGKRLEENKDFVVEGVCLLSVLERVGLSLGSLVYVKRYRFGLWADESDLTVPSKSLEAFLTEERELVAHVSGEAIEDEPSLFEAIVRYHSQYRPYERANFVFKWQER